MEERFSSDRWAVDRDVGLVLAGHLWLAKDVGLHSLAGELRICPEDVLICREFKVAGNTLELFFALRDDDSRNRLHLEIFEELIVPPLFAIFEDLVASLRLHSLLLGESDLMFLEIGLEGMGLESNVSENFHLLVDI